MKPHPDAGRFQVMVEHQRHNKMERYGPTHGNRRAALRYRDKETPIGYSSVIAEIEEDGTLSLLASTYEK